MRVGASAMHERTPGASDTWKCWQEHVCDLPVAGHSKRETKRRRCLWPVRCIGRLPLRNSAFAGVCVADDGNCHVGKQGLVFESRFHWPRHRPNWPFPDLGPAGYLTVRQVGKGE